MKKLARTYSLPAFLQIIAGLIYGGNAPAVDIGSSPEFAGKVEKNYFPYVGRYFPQRVFRGDARQHPFLSPNAAFADFELITRRACPAQPTPTAGSGIDRRGEIY